MHSPTTHGNFCYLGSAGATFMTPISYGFDPPALYHIRFRACQSLACLRPAKVGLRAGRYGGQVNQTPPFVLLIRVLPILPEALFSRVNRNRQPVLRQSKRAGIFFVILTERIVGPVKIDQYVSALHRLDIEITSL